MEWRQSEKEWLDLLRVSKELGDDLLIGIDDGAFVVAQDREEADHVQVRGASQELKKVLKKGLIEVKQEIGVILKQTDEQFCIREFAGTFELFFGHLL